MATTTFTKCANCDNLWESGGSGAFKMHLTQAHAMSDDQAGKEVKRERDRRYQASKREHETRAARGGFDLTAAQTSESNAAAALAAHDEKRAIAAGTMPAPAATRGAGTVRARLAAALGADAVKAHRLNGKEAPQYSCSCSGWQGTCDNRGAAYKGHDAHLEALIAAASK